MTVKLTPNGRPVAWGSEQIRGEDIPDPPQPAREHRWDGSEWVHEPIQPGAWYDRPGVVDRETRQVIKEQFETKGASALSHYDAVDQNQNIPQEVADLFADMLAMQYLGYVALTGERIQSIEDRFF